jgi:hypothetical protein
MKLLFGRHAAWHRDVLTFKHMVLAMSCAAAGWCGKMPQ